MREATHPVRVGVVADPRLASFGPWEGVEVNLIWATYVEAIAAAGGAPVVFPPTEAYAAQPELALEIVDGLLLNGGPDIAASSYGVAPHPESDPGSELRDRVELSLARAAIDRGIPILGVCRGMQILNLALGGGIDQHLPDEDAIHRGESTSFNTHTVEPVAGSLLASVIGEKEVAVQSYHHQGLDPIAPDLTLTAQAPDGLPEAAELRGHDFCLAVLWHPEQDLEGGGQQLFTALVDAAGNHRDGAPV